VDKYEYRVRSEEIDKLMSREKYAEAANVADMIDWRRVKNISMLIKIADLYRKNTRNEDCRDILLLAYEKYPTNRTVVYNLCEVSIELYDIVAAVQYFNLYKKIAPRDNGVIILHYRLLEAQEASLEERIALLEELKKRDYQEEWGYELAYLYHRVGLATKCAEECDQIVLWFGHGPYVMKALELKKLHMPLTESQQKKYDAMLENAQENYGEEAYANDSYNEDETNNIEETYSQEIYENNNYDENETNIEETYSQEIYENNGYDENGNYIGDTYAADNSYDENGNYIGDGYAAGSYDENGNYIENAYAQDAYDNRSDTAGYYENEQYAEEGYAENSDAGAYNNDQYYNDDFYTEQTYDGSNTPIVYEDETNNGYAANHMQPSSNGDMSLYNTINLQKVVAEGMKELYPDSDDIFAEQREALEESELVSEALQEKEKSEEVFLQDEAAEEKSAEVFLQDEAAEEEVLSEEATEAESADEAAAEEVYEPEASQTGKMAMLLDDVSEAAPGPDTGAVRTIFVPGESARAIKADSDMKELRSTTERSVNEEQTRMEKNSENVYRDMELFNTEVAQEPAFQPMTGQMNINDVLSEWENIKLDNAKKHQEEIKQRVLTQTGKIFANFDDSLKDGILGELEKEESAPVESTPKKESGAANDDEYDVSYVLPGSNKQIITEIEAVVAKELGATRVIPQEEVHQALAQMQSEEVSAAELQAAEQAGNVLYEEAGEDEANTYFGESPETYDETGEYDTEANDLYDNVEEYYEEPQPEDEAGYADLQTQDEAYYEDETAAEDETGYEEDMAADFDDDEFTKEASPMTMRELDPEDAESIAETAKEDALKTQEIKMNTADLSSLSERIVETAKREATGAKREEVREFTVEEQKLFENFAVTKKIKKQILYALENMTLAAFTGNVIITGDTGIDTVRMAKNLIREFQAADPNFSGKVAKITGEKLNQRNLKEVFEKLDNGGIIIEKANGMTEEKLYELASLLNQENLGIVVIIEDTKKEITRLLEKQAMIADYFNIRIDLMEMDNNALVAYARNYALALEYSIDELGTLALYTRIANIQSGNHVVTKDEVREIIDEAIWKSKKSKVKNFVDILFARRYDNEDMIVLKERDFM